MFNFLLSAGIVVLIVLLSQNRVIKWINKEPDYKLLKRPKIAQAGETFAVISLYGNTDACNLKRLLFQDIAVGNIIQLDLPCTHNFIATLSDEKIAAIQFIVFRYGNVKIRTYPLIPEIETYKLENLKVKIKEIEYLKKAVIIYISCFISILILEVVITRLLSLFL